MNDLKRTINYQFPLVLIDKIIDVQEENRLVAIKNVTVNEIFFQNSLLTDYYLPEGFIIESIKQTAHILINKCINNMAVRIFFDAIEKINFYKTVYAGDQLRIEIELLKLSDQKVKIEAKALVDGQLILEGNFRFILTEPPSRPQIHPTASVHHSAILGKDAVIGPYSIVGENVIIGPRTILEAHTMVEKWTQIGEDCHIHFGSVIGSQPQDKKYQGEKGLVKIGDRTVIREYTTVNRPTGDDTTLVGSDCLFLTNVHIGHNCKIGNGVVITNLTHISGHIEIQDQVIIGGMVGMHQFVRIGKGCMVGGYSKISQDLPPFMLCEGNPVSVRTPNVIGLRRSGASRESLAELKQIYKTFYRSNLNIKQALTEIENQKLNKTEEARYFVDFIKSKSKRGITRLALETKEDEEIF
ncbi:MAG: acyl-ACP--UDP-N-acetylglucosamine O-acyltransferase [Candidatus Margulisiibacteriota bacterium]|jgi:UDP-N-acetylglucosamine acyltransferase